MSLVSIFAGALHGVDALPVEVEVNSTPSQNPEMKIVGLPDAAVRESTDRVLAAIKNTGLSWPAQSAITINLAPADIRKEGPIFDLPIAIGLAALNQQKNGVLKEGALEKCAIVGELALDGRVRKVRGILPLTLQAREIGLKAILVPKENAAEAAIVDGIYVYGVESFGEAYQLLTGEGNIRPEKLDRDAFFHSKGRYEIDFCDVKGQGHVKRAMEVAMAGGHNCLIIMS